MGMGRPVPIGSRFGGLRDLPADPLYQRIAPPQPGAGSGTLGPVIAPVVTPPVPANLDNLYDLIARLPDALQLVLRRNFMIVPREAVPIVVPSVPTSVAASSQVNIVSYTVPDQYVGFITAVGFDVAGNAWDSINWSFVSNNAIHPALNEQTFNAPSLSTPLPFPVEITQSRLVRLRANNTNTSSPIYCSAILIGWIERMTAEKGYGTAPRSGI